MNDDAGPGWIHAPFEKWIDGDRLPGQDPLTVEEPIEFRILDQPVATVMRTPGDDRDLALGFLFGEGWISSHQDVGSLCVCVRPGAGSPAAAEANVVNLIPASGWRLEPAGRRRAGPVTSSCGICGKETIAEILRTVPRPLAGGGAFPREPRLDPEVLVGLPEGLRGQQPLFGRTGALHAAGIFSTAGRPLLVKEDIGRHNAVDKAIGAFVRAGEIPLDRHVLVVSGRASFEIVQKALRAGIPVVASVSGVSSLAVQLAQEGGVTLCGFIRGRSFSVYSHPHRIGG